MTKQCFTDVMGPELCPGPGDVVSFHTQLQLNGVLEIPINKPSLEDIFNITHEIDVTKLEIVRVNQPPGKKVLVVGKVRPGMEYIANVPDQKVHFAHWEIPFQALLKKDDGSPLDINFNLADYVVHVCVENEDYSIIDDRTIAKEIVLLIWLQEKTN